jgi:hypothetical protein|tara:strand:+ start:1623 stop:2114 length:492 start_codon:yes stop_codon:yes gene_type:complete
MSAGNAAAIRRRVNIQGQPPAVIDNNLPTPQTTIQPNPKGMTLSQYMTLLDKRLKTLEDNTPAIDNVNSVFAPQVMDEFNSRFEILATELGELKDALLKLQTFTMDVNKSLHDERIHILSDMGNQSHVNPTIITENVDESTNVNMDESTSVNIKGLDKELNKN